MEKPKCKSYSISKESNIFITGSAGFLGRNLVARLKMMGYKNLLLLDVDSEENQLETYAQKADFVFHLAGINRPQNTEEFYDGNRDLTKRLVEALIAAGKCAPMVLSSTAQVGNGTDYGKSKEEAESAVARYNKKSDAEVFIYRLPGVFGKWSKPNYNTVVATFCYNIARGLPIEVRDMAYSFPICYVDDVVSSFISCMTQDANKSPKNIENEYTVYGIEPTYEVALGWLAGTLRSFARTRNTLGVPNMGDELTRKLWATYLSFLPEDGYSYPLTTHGDDRGSFTEFLRMGSGGQVSVNVIKPGIVKGEHWHDTKNEKFLVVKGKAVIRFRNVNSAEVIEYNVSDEAFEVVDIPPGYTHNIENVGENDLVTVMWASELYNEDFPDTYHEKV